MSEPSKAVFLSYASQDAEAAKRIAEALRAAGVEVWFDQNELVGGDQWDQKIRGQVKSCALFVPIISAATQARTEGYFRLEWRLADQRTHLMAKGRPFLLPVVIDATRDAEAQVPDSFTEVQWTRLPGGETPPAFAARVKQLLGGSEMEAGRPRPDQRDGGVASPVSAKRRPSRPWLVPAILGAAVIAALAIWQPWRGKGKPVLPASPAAAPAPLSEARRLAGQARALLLRLGGSASRLEAATLLCERALTLDPIDADLWAVASQIDSRMWFHALDRSEKRSESARSKAAKAVNLAPDSFEARLGQQTYLVLVAGRPQADQAEPVLRALRAENPGEPRVLDLLSKILMAQGRQDESLALTDEWARLPGSTVMAMVNKAWYLHGLRRVPEMEEALAQVLAVQPAPGAVTLQIFYDLAWHGEPDRALAALRRLPAEELNEDIGVAAAVRVYRWRREPEELLRFLATVPREWIYWGANAPKAALTGDAHAERGRSEAARADWQRALELVEQRLATAPNDAGLLLWKAYLLASLGEAGRAREAYARSLAMPVEVGLLNIEKFQRILPPDALLDELEKRASGTAEALEQKRPVPTRFISAADLRGNPAWDTVRSLPRFQALLARLDADPRFNPKARPRETTATVAVNEKSVAVLAFANLSDDKANEYFSDGISEELLNVLAKIPGLKVSARTSAFYFKGKEVPIPEIAKQLGVAYVVEGSVRKQGDKVRITAQLIKAADGFHVWSDTFTRDLKDIFAVQDEIAGLIAQQLQLKLGATKVARVVNPEAYRLVLEGRFFWLQRTEESFVRAEAAYKKALEHDPQFAQARAGLADVWSIRAWYKLIGGNRQVEDDLSRAHTEVRLAIQIDPSLAETYATLGAVLFNQRKFSEANQAFQTSLRLNPNYGFAHHWYAQMLFAEGRPKEGLLEFDRAISADPLAFISLASYAVFLSNFGLYEEALAMNDRAIALRSGMFVPAIGQRADILLKLGRKEEALALARSVVQQATVQPRWWMDGTVIHVLRATGQQREAEAYAAQLLQTLPPDNMVRGYVLAGVGRPAEAVQQLLATGLDSSMIFSFIYDSFWDEVRKDPRLPELLAKLNLVEEYRRGREALVQLGQERGRKK